MNRELIEAANLSTFHAAGGLPPAEYVLQEMATRGGGYEAPTLREHHARILAAQSVNGLALVILLRVIDKEDAEKQGFVTVAHDLTGALLFRSGMEEGAKLPKSTKTGYREFGEVVDALAANDDLVVNAISRERDAALNRAEHLQSLLREFGSDAGHEAAQGTAENEAAPVASISTPTRRASRQQGARRE